MKHLICAAIAAGISSAEDASEEVSFDGFSLTALKVADEIIFTSVQPNYSEYYVCFSPAETGNGGVTADCILFTAKGQSTSTEDYYKDTDNYFKLDENQDVTLTSMQLEDGIVTMTTRRQLSTNDSFDTAIFQNEEPIGVFYGQDWNLTERSTKLKYTVPPVKESINAEQQKTFTYVFWLACVILAIAATVAIAGWF